MLPKIGGDALSGYPANARANCLDRDHEGRSQNQRPKQSITELGSSLGVRGDPAWVIISDTGDEPGADPRQGMLLKAQPKDLERS